MIKLILCVFGESTKSKKIAADFRKTMAAEYGPNFILEIVDLMAVPELAERYGVIATPTLIKTSPEPTRRIVGDLSDNAKVLEALKLLSLN
jgi:circadian clock protein KaiB